MRSEAGEFIDLARNTAWPLIPRSPEEVICFRNGQAITVGAFLAEAGALAARLPPAGQGVALHAINLCTDRYRMLVGFVAALLRGHVTLLHADPEPGRLLALAGRYPGAYVIADGEQREFPLPAFRLAEGDSAAGEVVAVPEIPVERIVAIGFTSGSTGEPAAHPKPWGALVAAAQAAAERFSLHGSGAAAVTLLATVPPQHMYGFETTIMLPLQAGMAIHAGASFFPSDVLDALAWLPTRRVLVTTPLHLRALLAEGRRPAALEAVISATAPLAASMAEAVERDWQTPMLEIYGATEAGSMASRRTVREADWLPYRGVELREAGVQVPGLGEVALADVLEPSGAGRFRLLGRRSDLVKLGGRRASLADLNRRLLEIEGVEDGVFVAPDDLESNPGARLSAYVVAPGLTAEAVLAALRTRLEPLFLPRPILLVPALPRDRLGKLSRSALAGLRVPATGPA
ncbi:AMP-binding protein [Siccirubricoccus phaeus]|uniref:AMP-binding protein n=1 Tax=Siccirubricoccus phaeus TaxID=2595053 RepID=UPI0011F26E64|nr:AMP-binding protein [Siccirubricoccus phaeus]